MNKEHFQDILEDIFTRQEYLTHWEEVFISDIENKNPEEFTTGQKEKLLEIHRKVLSR